MINIGELLLNELKRESVSTKKILDCVPDGKNDWRPHEKSFTLGRLASHVAEIPHWINWVLESEEYDMLNRPFERHVCADHTELMEYFEAKHSGAFAALEQATNDDLMPPWTFRAGDRIISQGSRYDIIRAWAFNHQVHHRAQLGVYLRLLDIPIPGMYGPSTDDRLNMEATAAGD